MSMPMTSVGRAALTLSTAAALLIVAGWAIGEWLDAIAAPGPAAVWDQRIFAWAVGQQSPWLNVIMEAVTWLGSPVLRIAIGVTAAVYLVRRNADRRWPAFMLSNTIGVMLIYSVVKLLVTRPRPDVDALVIALGHSWPSGHAAGGAALYLSLAYAAAASRPRSANGWVVWFGAVVTAAMIGASRVYLGVHWPSDVLAGVVMGTAWVAISASALITPSPASLHRRGGQPAGKAGTSKHAPLSGQVVTGDFAQSLGKGSQAKPGRSAHRSIEVLAIVAAMTLASTAPAQAQYFGSNKVQYREFDFQVLATEHFDVHYYPEQREAVQLAARMAERWHARLSIMLGHELRGRQPLILYAAHPHFQQTNVVTGTLGEGTGGVTEMFKRRIVLPFAGGLAETDHVLGHELVHAFQFDIASQRLTGGTPTAGAIMQLPLWFIEGMAEYLSLGAVDAHTAMWVREASFREQMPSVRQLDDPRFFPYRYGHAFWAYVAGRWGDRAVGDMLRSALASGGVEPAIRDVLGVDADTLTRDWHEATRVTYAPLLETTRPAQEFGQAIVTREGSGGDINVGPALSGDGRRVVFLSERSLFSIDMYLADAESGRVTRRIVRTAGDPHFDSLQFLKSAGTWAPDNRRVMFAALSRGRPVLTTVDADTGRVEHERAFPEFGEIFTPAWSPDGRQVLFTALTGGLLDLHLYDISTDTVRPLTRDPFAELDPAWSPDGQRIAYATDRFTSSLDTLSFGEYRIAIMQVASGETRPLTLFDVGRQSRPQWTNDGGGLYFVATPDGIPNIYRLDLRGGSPAPAGEGVITRITNLRSGVSGITPLTPAISVATAAARLVFTVFEEDRYNIYRTDAGTLSAASESPDLARQGARLPSTPPAASEAARLLSEPAVGLPEPTPHESSAYRPRLSLDAIGQPTVGVGVDRFGAFAAGGVSLLFSDMLGDHTLGTTIQLTSRFEEFGGVAAYINKRARWNWGLIGDQTPFVSGSVAQGPAVIGGQPVLMQQELRIVQTNRGASGVVQYPFSRAQRLEMSAGLRTLTLSQRVDTRVYSAFTGQLLDERREDLPRPDRLTFAETGGALVYDSSIAGATGPILGQRYRFEYTQVSGSLLYGGVLGDFRRYFMPVRPFTIALRGLQYGRYGRDSEDPRLQPLFLGQPGLVRGYEVQSFTGAECGIGGGCPAFDRLVGSRIAVASAELRFPIVGLFTRRTLYGPVPVDLAIFGDAGAAWTSEQTPSLLGGTRNAVRSVGLAVRVNALGFAVAEIAYARPLDRPGRGWLWQFNLTQGF